MSFSLDIKEEIIRKNFNSLEQQYLLKGFLIFNSHIELKDHIVWCHIMSISAVVVRQIYTWLKSKYNITGDFWTSKQTGFSKDAHYHLKFNDDEYHVLRDLEIYDAKTCLQTTYLNPNVEYNLVRAYVAGIFIALGSVNAPSSSKYHLALYFRNYDEAQHFRTLMRKFKFDFKIIEHGKRVACYLKPAALISDFLKFIDATSAIFIFEDRRIYRDMTSSINRLNNIEIHNQQAINTAADLQIQMIEELINHKKFSQLPDRVKHIANLRLQHPEASFRELADIYNLKYHYNVTKSAVHHWFRILKTHYESEMGKR